MKGINTSIEKDVKREVVFSRIESLVKGRSISQFARDCGIKQPVMDTYVKRKRMPVMENIVKICAANNVTADWLLGMSDQPDGASLDDKSLLKRCANAEQKLTRVNKALGHILVGTKELQEIIEDGQRK